MTPTDAIDYWPIALIVLPLLTGLVGYAVARHEGKAPRAALTEALEELKAVSHLLLMAHEQLAAREPARLTRKPHNEHTWTLIGGDATSDIYWCGDCPQTRQVPKGTTP